MMVMEPDIKRTWANWKQNLKQLKEHNYCKTSANFLPACGTPPAAFVYSLETHFLDHLLQFPCGDLVLPSRATENHL